MGSYRLVLKIDCEYQKYLHDRDRQVDWDDVFSLECFVEDQDCCPICLMPYCVPRAAKCGHIFCFSCIMYYIHQHEDDWAKCPMCGESFDLQSLRPVRLLSSTPPIAANGQCTMELVLRQPHVVNGFSAKLPDVHERLRHPFPPADSPPAVTAFCHLLGYSPRYELACLEHDLAELDRSVTGMNEVGEVLLLGASQVIRDDLQRRLQLVRDMAPRFSSLASVMDSVMDPVMDSVMDSTESFVVASIETSAKTSNQSSINSSITSSITSPLPESQLLFYYGCPTHLTYYLHPFTQKCLRSQYHSCRDYPTQISSTVLHVDDTVLDETAQGAALEHLPPLSTLHAVELDVRPLLRGRLSDSLWNEVKQRAAARRRAERASKREERRIDVAVWEASRVETCAERRGVVLGAVCDGGGGGRGAEHYGLHELPHVADEGSGARQGDAERAECVERS